MSSVALALPLQVGGHRQQRGHRRDAGAADSGQHHVVALADLGELGNG
jgi:hypothetical protein